MITSLLMTVALVVGGGLGAAGVYSATSAADEAQRALLIARSEIGVEQAEATLEGYVDELEHVTRLFENGSVSSNEVAETHVAVAIAEGSLHQARLNLEEIRLSGREPRDDLGAPAVDGRDFVSERIEASRGAVQREAERREGVLSLTIRLFETGSVRLREVEQSRAELAIARAHEEIARRRLDLRKRFLDGRLAPVEVDLEDLIVRATAEMGDARIMLELAERAHEELAAMVQQGAASGGELLRARAQLRAAEARLRLAKMELRVAKTRLEASRQEKAP